MARVLSAAAVLTAFAALAAPAGAADAARPPVTWLKGEGNFTKAHRAPTSLDSIVVHVTEGAFWGSVQWLKNPRAHASSHFVVARTGKIVQLVHLSDIAWHAGNWKVNMGSIGIEHEGFTYRPGGFTSRQYESSARLTAWLARRALLPIDREHIIGHAEVPGPNGGRGGASHHTDPGPHWNWRRYLDLVRRYAHGVKLSVVTRLRSGPLAGIVPWRAATAGGVRSVEFVVDGQVVWTDRRPPFAFAGGRGLNTTGLANGSHVLELRAYGDGTRHDITRRTVVVDNRAFRLTTAGAREWTRVRGTVRLQARAWGAEARSVVLRVNGRAVARDARSPYVFRWNTRRVKDRMHVLELEARSIDGRTASRRIPLVVRNRPLRPPRPKLPPTPQPRLPKIPALAIVDQSVADGQEVEGLVLWRVFVEGPAKRVEFTIDGVLRGRDLAPPYTLGWDTSLEPSGPHVLSVRVLGTNGKAVGSMLTVMVPERPASADTAAP
jgi:hypothetical protein